MLEARRREAPGPGLWGESGQPVWRPPTEVPRDFGGEGLPAALLHEFPWLRFLGGVRAWPVEDLLASPLVTMRRVPRECVAGVARAFEGVLAALVVAGPHRGAAAALWALVPRLLLAAVVEPGAPLRDTHRPGRQHQMRAVLRTRLDRFEAGQWEDLLRDAEEAMRPLQDARRADPGGLRLSEVSALCTAREVVRLGRPGQLRKAAQRLVSAGLAPVTEDSGILRVISLT